MSTAPVPLPSTSNNTWRGLALGRELLDRCDPADVEVLAEFAAEAQRLIGKEFPWTRDDEVETLVVPSSPGSVDWQSILATGTCEANGCFAARQNGSFVILGIGPDLDAAVWLFAAVRERMRWIRTARVRKENRVRKQEGRPSLTNNETAQIMVGTAVRIADAVLAARKRVDEGVHRNGTNVEHRDLYARMVRAERVQYEASAKSLQACGPPREVPLEREDDLRKIVVLDDGSTVVRDEDLEIVVRYVDDDVEVTALTHLPGGSRVDAADDAEVEQRLAASEVAMERWSRLQHRLCARQRVAKVATEIQSVSVEQLFGIC